jgi:hypothetical protein
MKEIVIIKHTSEYRGDHSVDINEAYIFPETATLKEVMEKLDNTIPSMDREWFEIPVQGES